jgi:SSS family solute:Na+ symporter
VFATLAGFAVVVLAVGIWSSRRVSNVDDFVVAGRKLGFSLAFPTLLATWFGAGTLLVAADEVAGKGLRASALDPLGGGVCLLLAGLFLARPLWQMRMSTLPDFFGRVYGPSAEVWASLLLVPGYVGWVAAQYQALAVVLEHTWGIDREAGLALVAALGIAVTWLGGLWAVALSGALQMGLVAVGLTAISWMVFGQLGHGDLTAGAALVWTETPQTARALIPLDAFGAWSAAFLAGSLGNLPGQDLTQRMFAARSEAVAQGACLAAGVSYLLLGVLPMALALAARPFLGVVPERGVLQAMVDALGVPGLAMAFTLVVAAAVLSTIDSAILAPSSVLARNVLKGWVPETLALHRGMALAVGLAALALAWLGEDAYSLLEASYEVTMVSLLVPLVLGVYWPRGLGACLASMAVGTTLWLLHRAVGLDGLFGSPIPMGIGSTLLALLAYRVVPAGRPRHFVRTAIPAASRVRGPTA